MATATQLALWRRVSPAVARATRQARVAPANRLPLVERLFAFKEAFPTNMAAWPWMVREAGHDALYAVWVIGNDYRNRSRFYGAYPHGYLPRVMALFPDIVARMRGGEVPLLHVFSGSLPKRDVYARCDVRQHAEFACSIYDLPALTAARFPLVLADPPYSAVDAKQYGTPMVNRRRAMAAIAEVTEPGGHRRRMSRRYRRHHAACSAFRCARADARCSTSRRLKSRCWLPTIAATGNRRNRASFRTFSQPQPRIAAACAVVMSGWLSIMHGRYRARTD